MTVMQATKERWCEAEAHRVAARSRCSRRGETRQGASVARPDHCASTADAWELRAAMSLPRLLRDQGKRQMARDLLAPIYDWFTKVLTPSVFER